MKEFKIGNESEGFIMNLPTKLSEITKDYLLGVTNHINVAPYYCIVATVYRAKLPEIISSAKKSKAMATTIVPLFVRANPTMNTGKDTYNMFASIKPCDKLIIAGTDIERGYQLTCPKNFITYENIVRIYNSDAEFAKGVMLDQNYYYFIDFKLVPITDIKGFYSTDGDKDFVNPFIIRNNSEN